MAKEFTGGALTLSPTAIGFNPQGTAMVPVTAGGGQKLGTISIKSPMETFREVFFDIKDKLSQLVESAKTTLGIEKKQEQRDMLKRGETGKVGDGKEEKSVILESLKKAFGDLKEGLGGMTIGEKLQAVLLVGALLLFNQVRDKLVPIVSAVVKMFQGLIEFLGPKGTFYLFLGGFLGFKTGLIGAVAKFTGLNTAVSKVGSLIGKGLTNAFVGMEGFIKKTIIPGLMKAYGGVKGFLATAVTKLGLAFKSMRLFMTATMIPALTGMMTSMSAMIVPLLPIIAIVAGVVLLLASLKSGFDTFKQSLADGESMMTAILKGLGDTMATLYTLPMTLVKNLIAWFADMLGFKNFAEKLRQIDFKQALKDAFVALFTKVKDFIGAIFDFDLGEFFGKVGNIAKQLTTMLKAIALGALAAIKAAWPGGESPGSAYKRVYNEVMGGNEAPALPNEKNESDSENVEPKEGALATAKAAMTTNQAFSYDNKTINNNTTIMREKIIQLLKQQLDLELFKFQHEKEKDKAIMVNNVKQGDNTTQTNNTFQAVELASDHTESSQKLLNTAIG